MVEGAGLQQIFDSTGQLILEKSYIDSVPSGRRIEIGFDNVVSVSTYLRGQAVGLTVTFYQNGNVSYLSFRSPAGLSHGPTIEFLENGMPVSTEWYVSTVKVSENAYRNAAAADPTLPTYHANVVNYVALTDSAKGLAAEFRQRGRVRIPLTRGPDGKWLPAEP